MKKVKVLLLVIVGLIFLGQIDTIKAYAEENDTENSMEIIIVLDKSTSMLYNNVNEKETRMECAKKATKMLVDYFANKYLQANIRIMLFSGTGKTKTIIDSEYVYEEQGFIGKEIEKIGKETDPESIFSVGGPTDMGEAFLESVIYINEIKEKNPNKKVALIFLTDGIIEFLDPDNAEIMLKDKIYSSSNLLHHVLGMEPLYESGKKAPEGEEIIEFEERDYPKKLKTPRELDCPIYMIAFGKKAYSGLDMYDLSQLPGCSVYYVGYAKDEEDEEYEKYEEGINDLKTINKEIFQSITNTKAEIKSLELKSGWNELPIMCDENLKGATVSVKGKGKFSSGEIPVEVYDESTGKTIENDELENMIRILGIEREAENNTWIMQIGEKLLKSRNLKVGCKLLEQENIEMISYYYYNIEVNTTLEKKEYCVGDAIQVKSKVSGIDTNNVQLYAILLKNGKQDQLNYKVLSDVMQQTISIYGTENMVNLMSMNHNQGDEINELKKLEVIPMILQEETGDYYCTFQIEEAGEYEIELYAENDKISYFEKYKKYILQIQEKIAESETEILETQEEEQNTSWWDGLWKGVQAFGAWLADTGNKIGNKFNASVQKLGEWCPEWLPDWWPFPWPNKE